MTREDVLKEIKAIPNNNILLTLPTGFGKTRNAIERVKHLVKKHHKTLLVVVPRNVLKVNWADEFKKWWPNCRLDITYTTYVSFPRHKGNWDFIIYDEAHHLSDRCREAICDFNAQYSILLSATVKRELKEELREVFDNLYYYNITLRKAIEDEVLPDPRVYLWSVYLRNDVPTEYIIKNPKAKGQTIECSWAARWQYIKQKNNPVKIYCTEKQYYIDLSSSIDYWKRRYMCTRNEIAKNKWLRLCSERLKWLSDKKVKYVQLLLPMLINNRTLTFCNSIEQTELLGEYCINSKNDNSLQHLEDFNSGKINHITACNMINEGCNLTNCQVGIYANLNSSETIIKQRTGRLLRHKNPVIIIPYFKDTREEELIHKMLEDYNVDLVTKVSNYEEIKV